MKKKVNPFWLTMSLLLSVVILALCVYAGRGGSLRLQPEGNPQETVTRFFVSVIEGRYRDAYDCLDDYSSLGLENQPDSAAGRLLYSALRESYAFTLLGGAEVRQLSALQRLSFQSLDVKAVQAAAEERIDAVTERLVEELPSEEIYDEQMQYLPSFTDRVYETALRETLERAESYYSAVQLELTLSYRDGSWSMHCTQALLNALMGNA